MKFLITFLHTLVSIAVVLLFCAIAPKFPYATLFKSGITHANGIIPLAHWSKISHYT